MPPSTAWKKYMEVWLLNAAHMKAVPGRKSDVRDAEWIAQLLEHGLVGAVIRAATTDPAAADADPLPDAADGGPAPYEVSRLELMLGGRLDHVV